MAEFNILPPINSSGVINLKAPFQTLCAPNVPYTVVGVRTLSDIVNEGKDPYSLYYEPYGLDQSTFNNDVSNSVCILSLKSSSGEWVFVPNSYLLTAPVATGVPYVSVIVGVKLGAIPESLNLTYFSSVLKQAANDLLGVSNAEVKAVKASATTYLDLDDSKVIEAARANAMALVTTDSAKLLALQQTHLKATQRIAELEQFIRNNNWTPK